MEEQNTTKGNWISQRDSYQSIVLYKEAFQANLLVFTLIISQNTKIPSTLLATCNKRFSINITKHDIHSTPNTLSKHNI